MAASSMRSINSGAATRTPGLVSFAETSVSIRPRATIDPVPHVPDLDPVLTTLVTEAHRVIGQASPRQVAALLLDYLAVAGGDALPAGPDGIGRAAAAAHRADRDDIHWSTLVHPGSVIWPVVLASGGSAAMGGRDILDAAALGYEVTGALARLFAAAGITRWHRTSLAGQGGAAAAALSVRDEPAVVTEAIALALTTSSGIGQTMIERAAASGFHRSCAARNGKAAADFAAAGMRAPREVLSGPSGLIAATGGAPPGRLPPAASDSWVIDEVTLRVYPTNGFAQSAVAATVDLRATGLEATQLDVEVHPVVNNQFAGPPVNAHWDLPAAVAAAWTTGDPWCVDATHLDSPPSISVISADVPVGAARVTARSQQGPVSETRAADFAHPAINPALACVKWERLGIVDAATAWRALTEWLSSDQRLDHRGLSVLAALDTDRSPRR
jgi:MmgE/PrpD N-terminal domain